MYQTVMSKPSCLPNHGFWELLHLLTNIESTNMETEVRLVEKLVWLVVCLHMSPYDGLVKRTGSPLSLPDAAGITFSTLPSLPLIRFNSRKLSHRLSVSNLTDKTFSLFLTLFQFWKYIKEFVLVFFFSVKMQGFVGRRPDVLVSVHHGSEFIYLQPADDQPPELWVLVLSPRLKQYFQRSDKWPL